MITSGRFWGIGLAIILIIQIFGPLMFSVPVFAVDETVHYGIDLDGNNDYVQLGTSALLKPTDELTIELWVNPDDWTPGVETAGKIERFISNTARGGYSIEISGGIGAEVVKFELFIDGAYKIMTYPAVGLSGWHHIAFTYDHIEAECILYLDGLEMNRYDFGDNQPIYYREANGTFLGVEAGDALDPDGHYYKGQMDEVRIWNSVRTEAELNANLYKYLIGTEANLIAYYNFNENGGLTANDVSPNGLDGNLINGTVWTVSKAMAPLNLTLTNPSTTGLTSTWIGDDSVGYQIQIDDDIGFASPISPVTGADVVVDGYKYTDTISGQDLSPGTYYYRVAAYEKPAGPMGPYTTASFLVPTLVTYKGNNQDSGTLPANSAGTEGDGVVLPLNSGDLVKAGYTFEGWNTLANGTGTHYDVGENYTLTDTSIELYAEWQAIDYSVTYNGNGNTSGQVALDGNLYNITDHATILGKYSLYRAGYSFEGWNTTSGGGGIGYASGDTLVMGVANVVLYADWQLLPTTGTSPYQRDQIEVIVERDNPLVDAEVDRSNGLVAVNVTFNTMDLQRALVIQPAGQRISLQADLDEIDAFNILLTGDIVKSLEDRAAIVDIIKGDYRYCIPAEIMDIDGIAERFGNPDLEEIVIEVQISKVDFVDSFLLGQLIETNMYQQVMAPIEFNVTYHYMGESIELDYYHNYVERLVRLPDQADPTKITTALVYTTDGAFLHIPTSVQIIDGVYYAVINSLTNSVYTLIYNPVQLELAQDHWAETAINELASRTVISEMDIFECDE